MAFIREHRYFYRVALRSHREFPLHQIFGPMWEQIVKPFCEKAGITSENEMMFYFVAFQAGFTIILKRWLDQDCIESDETMAQIIRNIIPSIWKSKVNNPAASSGVIDPLGIR